MDSAYFLLPSPTPIFHTHHQDPIGDDFRNRLLTVKEEGFTGHHPPLPGLLKQYVLSRHRSLGSMKGLWAGRFITQHTSKCQNQAVLSEARPPRQLKDLRPGTWNEWINNSSNWTHLFFRVNSTCSSCESYMGVSKASVFKNLQKSQGLPLPPTFAQLSGLGG